MCYFSICSPLCNRRKQKEEKDEDEKQKEENLHVNKFVILCETFLQMYHAIFSQLQNYIFNGKMERSCATAKKNWKQNPQVPCLVEEYRDFDVSDINKVLLILKINYTRVFVIQLSYNYINTRYFCKLFGAKRALNKRRKLKKNLLL